MLKLAVIILLAFKINNNRLKGGKVERPKTEEAQDIEIMMFVLFNLGFGPFGHHA